MWGLDRREEKFSVPPGRQVGAGVIATLASWHGSFDWPPKYPVVAEKPAIRGPTPVRIIEEKRKVYPYSIIAGGARTVEEARRAMSDPAVRDHYGAFDLKQLKQVVLTADMSGYVSYRFGEKIYWTSKTVHLKAGETIYTDGQHIARGRCLNCYSAHPMMPTRPHEPAEVIMDTSVEVPIIAMTSPHLPLEEAPVLPAPGGVTTASGGSGLATARRRKIFPDHSHHPAAAQTPPQSAQHCAAADTANYGGAGTALWLDRSGGGAAARFFGTELEAPAVD